MSTVIRKVVGERWQKAITISEGWTLRSQIEALEQWLRDHPGELDPSYTWIADVGFAHRADAKGGGPPLTRSLMQMCIDANLEIYLSEYSFEAEEGEP